MEDIIIQSKYSKERTVKHIKTIFKAGNEFDVELTLLHGEYYLTPVSYFPMQLSSKPFFMQFRIKESGNRDLEQSIVSVTPQSNVLATALGSIFLLLVWIIIFAVSISEKRLLDMEVYLAGLIITVVCFLLFRESNSKETRILKRLKLELE